MHSSLDLRGHTVLALHAHPDDEAIFTGITLRRLADAGARVVLAVATAGELGQSRVPLAPGRTIAEQRTVELERSAALLGVDRLVLLGRRDSGLPGWASGSHPRALAGAEPLQLAKRIARLADAEGAETMLYDDEHGIYGHPDHRAAHHIGSTAADLIGAVGYRITVDHGRVHRRTPSRHLVQGAAEAAGVEFGRAGDEITLEVSGAPEQVATKHAALLAHASQIGTGDLDVDDFAGLYGVEWYRHHGAPGALHLLAGPAAAPAGPLAAVSR